MKLVYSTGSPTELLDYLTAHQIKNAFYLLDVNLQHEMNGIILAAQIREKDALGKIVFITTHAELSHLAFKYWVEAMDYIIKDMSGDVTNRIKGCIDLAYKRYLDNNRPQKAGYQIKIGDTIRVVPFADIMFIESDSTPHMLVLHLENGQIKFRASLSSVAETNPDFYRCHKSYIVNVKNVKHIDKIKKEVEMSNGQIALVTPKKLQGLLDAVSSLG
jgi:two-component system response regulator AgrA